MSSETSVTSAKGYSESIAKIAVDSIVIILLALIITKLCQTPEPTNTPIELPPQIVFPSDIRVVHQQPPVVINIPDTITVQVKTDTLKVENNLPETLTVQVKTDAIKVENNIPDTLTVQVKTDTVKVENVYNSIDVTNGIDINPPVTVKPTEEVNVTEVEHVEVLIPELKPEEVVEEVLTEQPVDQTDTPVEKIKEKKSLSRLLPWNWLKKKTE